MQAPDLIQPREHDLGGGFRVRRLLPSAARQAVGPFLFFDHFGPVTAGPDDDFDVRPHPHIGLATVTYLFEGAMMHRDSTGAVQRIEPGAINWMTAGRGIVHSERTPDDLRGSRAAQPRPAALGRAARGPRGGRTPLRAHAGRRHPRTAPGRRDAARARRRGVRRRLAGAHAVADAVRRPRLRRRCRARDPDGRRTSARSTASTRPVRARRRAGAGADPRRARAGLGAAAADAGAGAHRPRRRRAARAALHGLELRVEPARAHRWPRRTTGRRSASTASRARPSSSRCRGARAAFPGGRARRRRPYNWPDGELRRLCAGRRHRRPLPGAVARAPGPAGGARSRRRRGCRGHSSVRRRARLRPQRRLGRSAAPAQGLGRPARGRRDGGARHAHRGRRGRRGPRFLGLGGAGRRAGLDRRRGRARTPARRGGALRAAPDRRRPRRAAAAGGADGAVRGQGVGDAQRARRAHADAPLRAPRHRRAARRQRAAPEPGPPVVPVAGRARAAADGRARARPLIRPRLVAARRARRPRCWRCPTPNSSRHSTRRPAAPAARSRSLPSAPPGR